MRGGEEGARPLRLSQNPARPAFPSFGSLSASSLFPDWTNDLVIGLPNPSRYLMIMSHRWHNVNVAETPRKPPTFENAGARPLPGPRLGLVVKDLHVEAPQPVVPQVEGEVGHVGEHVDEVGGQLLQAGAAHHQHQLVTLDALEGVQGQRVQLRARQLQLLELGAERAVDLTWAGQFDRL